MKNTSSRDSGFSLIEVLVAITLLMVGMLGILALLPVGMIDYHDAKMKSVESQMVDFVVKQCSTGSPYELTGHKFYFDQQGVLCSEKDYEYLITLSVNQVHGIPNNQLLTLQLKIIRKGSRNPTYQNTQLFKRT